MAKILNINGHPVGQPMDPVEADARAIQLVPVTAKDLAATFATIAARTEDLLGQEVLNYVTSNWQAYLPIARKTIEQFQKQYGDLVETNGGGKDAH